MFNFLCVHYYRLAQVKTFRKWLVPSIEGIFLCGSEEIFLYEDFEEKE